MTAGGATGAALAPVALMLCAALESGAAPLTVSPQKESNAANAARRSAAEASSVATEVFCVPPTGSSAGLRARNEKYDPSFIILSYNCFHLFKNYDSSALQGSSVDQSCAKLPVCPPLDFPYLPTFCLNRNFCENSNKVSF